MDTERDGHAMSYGFGNYPIRPRWFWPIMATIVVISAILWTFNITLIIMNRHEIGKSYVSHYCTVKSDDGHGAQILYCNFYKEK